MPLPKLTGDIESDLSPLTGNIEQDLGPSPLAPQAKELPDWASPKTLGGIPLPFETRVNRPQMELGASLAVPGGKVLPRVLGPLAQPVGTMLGQAAVSGGSELLHGGGPLQAGKEAAASAAGTGAGVLAGKVAGKAIGPLTSGMRLEKHTEGVVKNLATTLQKRVPWFKGFKTDTPGLTEMLYGQEGFNALHQGYDQALKDVIKRGTGRTISLLPEEVDRLKLKSITPPSADPKRAAEIAKSLGVPVDDPRAQGIIAALGFGPKMGTEIEVDAGEAAKAITGKWGKSPEWAELYRKVVGILDDEGIGDPASRAAYKTAMGLRDYMSQTGAFGPRGLDLMKAQSGLGDKTSDQLMRRQLGEFAEIMSPGQQRISKGRFNAPGAALGGTLGGLLGGGLIPGYGHVGGITGGALAGSRIPFYKGLPPSPMDQGFQGLISRLGGYLAPGVVPDEPKGP